MGASFLHQEKMDFKLGMVILCSFCAFISVILGLFICLVYFHNNKKIGSMKWSLLAILMFSTTNIGFPFFYSSIVTSAYLPAAMDLCWSFGTIFVYILLLKRFQKTFEHTKYDTFTSQRRNIYIFYSFCFIFVILDMISKALFLRADKISTEEYSIYTLIVTIIQQLIDFTLSFGLIGLFVHKLKCLNKDIEYSKSVAIYVNHKETYEQSQYKILNILSKVTLLSIIVIVSSQLYLLYRTSIFVLASFYNHDISDLEVWVLHGYLSIDCVINAICIFLSFDFNNKCYTKICCHQSWTKLFHKTNDKPQSIQKKKSVLTANRNRNTLDSLEMRLLDDDDIE